MLEINYTLKIHCNYLLLNNILSLLRVSNCDSMATFRQLRLLTRSPRKCIFSTTAAYFAQR